MKVKGKKVKMMFMNRKVAKIVVLDPDDILNPREIFIETTDPIEIKGTGSWKIELTEKEDEK